MAMRAALQNKAFPTSLSRVIRNSFSTNTRLCTAVYDHTNPAAVERVSESVSDALAAKEKGPWTELSKEDKIACKFFICLRKSSYCIFPVFLCFHHFSKVRSQLQPLAIQKTGI